MKFKMEHENYNVADLERSLAFYEKALGLTEVRRNEAEDGSFAMVVPDPEDAAAVMALAQESAAQQGGYFSDFYVRLPDDYDSFYPHTLVHREDHALYVVARLRHSAWGPDDWTRWTWSMREKEDGTWESVDQGY